MTPSATRSPASAGLPSRVDQAETALRELYARLLEAERTALAATQRAEAAERERAREAERAAALDGELARTRGELHGARVHLEALEKTRLLRWAAGPRRVYGSVRRSIRG